MRTSFQKEWPLLLLVAVPFAYLGAIWNDLPEQVPLHWNLQGEADRWGSRSELWVIPTVTALLVYIIFLVIPQIDPKKRLAEMGAKYTQLKFLMVAAMAALAVMILHMAQTGGSVSTTPVLVVVGVLVAVLGNYMKTVRPNYFIGIRTPWTLESPEVWSKTHQLAGKLWFLGGLLMVAFALIFEGPAQFGLVLGTGLAVSLIPVVYSFLIYRRIR